MTFTQRWVEPVGGWYRHADDHWRGPSIQRTTPLISPIAGTIHNSYKDIGQVPARRLTRLLRAHRATVRGAAGPTRPIFFCPAERFSRTRVRPWQECLL